MNPHKAWRKGSQADESPKTRQDFLKSGARSSSVLLKWRLYERKWGKNKVRIFGWGYTMDDMHTGLKFF